MTAAESRPGAGIARAGNRGLVAGAGLGIGAILAAPAVAQADDFKVVNLSNDGAGSLRQAVLDANDDPGADRIVFKSKLSGRIELGDGLGLPIFDDLEILGRGARKLAVSKAGTGGSLFVPSNNSGGTLDVAISGLKLTGNTSAYNGGAIAAYAESGPVDLSLSRVTISGNSATGEGKGDADGDGGGVYANFEAGGGTLTIENSTISGNTAEHYAGGVYFDGGELSSEIGELSVRSSTISGNTAIIGGGMWIAYTNFTTAEILNSTVTANSAVNTTGGVAETDGGGTIRGSILAGNSRDFGYADLDDGPWSVSFSVIGNTTDAGIDDEGGNLLDVDPKLKPLKDNGGPTDTHAFKKSPAKNKGPSDAPNSDQRGAPRKGKADIGAYELTKCKGVIVNRVGTAGKDKLKGTKKADGILGLGGNDKLSGKKGKDGLCGGSGKDKLKGGPGKDKLDGGPGKDKEIQ